MAMPTPDTHMWTADDVRALPEEPGKRFECVDGVLLVSPGPRLPHQSVQAGHPLLFVEVLSPGTARYDRVVKRARYQRYGVEYWIFDADARLVERWTPEAARPENLSDRLTWRVAGATITLTIHLPELFAEALGETAG